LAQINPVKMMAAFAKLLFQTRQNHVPQVIAFSLHILEGGTEEHRASAPLRNSA
jgi:DnaJ-domain-containing protein 1